MTKSTADLPARNADASTAELVRTAAEQISRLVRDELTLARAEIAEKAKKAGTGAGLLGGSGVIALYGLAALLAAAILGLAVAMPAWLAALIVAVLLFATAGVLALVGRRELEHAKPPVPEETMRSVKRVVEDLKERVSR